MDKWLGIGALLLSTSATMAAPPEWQSANQVEYLCGGIGVEEFAEIKALRSMAGAELLFTAGERGAHLADVTVAVRGDTLAAPLRWTAAGPLCLVKLARGGYVVDAEYAGVKRSLKLRVGKGLSTLHFRFPQE